MSGYDDIVKKNYRVYIESLKDDIKAHRDPDYFRPSGVNVYCGRQGSGKTISAVKHLHDIKELYPKSIIVSNLILTEFVPIPFRDSDGNIQKILPKKKTTSELPPELTADLYYYQFSSFDELRDVLENVNNGIFGVIYIIDEIHTYFNSLESKNIPIWAFAQISQQRKNHKVIIGTSQIFSRMAKPLREQCDSIIMCKTVGGVFTYQKVYDGLTLEQDYDGSITGDLKKTGFFWHTRRYRNAFDTYQVIASSASLDLEQSTKPLELTKTSKKLFNKR